MDAKIDLVKYAKKLAKIVINESIMEDKIFDIIISDEDKAKIFFLISDKLRETGEEYLYLIKKKKTKELENLLNSLIKKGRKPWGKDVDKIIIPPKEEFNEDRNLFIDIKFSNGF